jgi:hypothetical protein
VGEIIMEIRQLWVKKMNQQTELLTEAKDTLNLALATIERLKPSKPYDSTQGTRDVINTLVAKIDAISLT